MINAVTAFWEPGLACAAEMLGLGLLRARARRPRPYTHAGVAWLLIGAGILLWHRALPAGTGISWALLLLGVAGLAVIAWDGFTLPAPPRRNGGRSAVTPPVTSPLRHRFLQRGLPRLLGCLILAPLLGAGCGLLWFLYGPGDASTRLTGLSLALIIGMAVALLVMVSSRHAWRALAALGLLTILLAALLRLKLPLA